MALDEGSMSTDAEALFPSANPTTVPNYDGYVPGKVPEVNPATNIPIMGQGLYEAGGAGGFTSDPLIYERFSYGTVEPAPIAYNEQKVREAEDLAQSAAALQSQGIRQYASGEYKSRLKTIVEEAGKHQLPDVITTVEGQRFTISAQATSVPANLTREDACRMLQSLIGRGETEEARKQDGHARVIEVLSCARTCGPAFAVPQRGNPKGGNPVVWLSQNMALEAKKQETYEHMPKEAGFATKEDADAVFKLTAALFSLETARGLQMCARLNNTNMLAAIRFLTSKICADRRKVVNPPYTSYTDFLDIIPGEQTTSVTAPT